MKKYVLVGAGSRALFMFAKPMATELKDWIQFCGVYDHNTVRAHELSKECGEVPVYPSFEQMLEETKPDSVVVATTDDTHHHYIIASLEAGCDVISEKPMTIDQEKCDAILEAERRTGRKVTVTFNLRFAPYFKRIKQLLKSGAIGEIHHVNLEWYLDRSHGAEYFRRWHAQLKNSGGLLVHKSTHHFDIINWWLDSEPTEVHAHGTRRFYGPTREERGERCLTCSYTKTCEFYKDYTENEFINRYYLQAEQEDGYIRDRCVFGEHIDIYDNMSVNVSYDSGALLSYSLVAYSPFEGWRATLHGSEGRLEATNFYGDANMAQNEGNDIHIYTPGGEKVTYTLPASTGSHGGGDERLRRMIFVGDIEDDLGQMAGSRAGAASLLIGASANRSIAERKAIPIQF